jgi:hypothetical protein
MNFMLTLSGVRGQTGYVNLTRPSLSVLIRAESKPVDFSHFAASLLNGAAFVCREFTSHVRPGWMVRHG